MPVNIPVTVLRVLAWAALLAGVLVAISPVFNESVRDPNVLATSLVLVTVPALFCGALVWALLYAVTFIVDALFDIADSLDNQRPTN